MSIFNLVKDQWVDHRKFEETVRQIFRNRRQNRRALKGEKVSSYDIGVLVGRSTFHFYEFRALGTTRLAKDKSIRVNGSIIDFSQDQ